MVDAVVIVDSQNVLSLGSQVQLHYLKPWEIWIHDLSFFHPSPTTINVTSLSKIKNVRAI